MTSPKFKVGDRVCVTYLESNDSVDNISVGVCGVIILATDDVPSVKFDSLTCSRWMLDDQLEHEHIYNSRLYKALQEEE